MTIKDNRAKTITFDDLCNGDTFIHNNNVYLVLPTVIFDGIAQNAYNLTNEYITYFEGDVTVEPVEVELTIK